MTLRTRYLLAFLAGTALTLIVVATAIWCITDLHATTNHLVDINSIILEKAHTFEKNLALSRRAEKEFFIFLDSPSKQAKYVASWEQFYGRTRKDAVELAAILERAGNKDLASAAREAISLITANESEFVKVVNKFQETKSYDAVDQAEYGVFKKRTHAIEEISEKIAKYGLDEVNVSRAAFARTKARTDKTLYSIAAVSLILSVALAFFMSRALTATILHLTRISNDISMGKLEEEIKVDRADELGELAGAIARMQKSIRIMLSRSMRTT